MLKINEGDVVYIIKHHKKGKKNIGYYIDKVEVYWIAQYLNKKEIIVREGEHNRRYPPHRLFKTYEEAKKQCDFKNMEKQLRDEYNENLKKLKADIVEKVEV